MQSTVINVAWSVCLSVCVCVLVTTVSPIKMRCSSEYGVYSGGPKERVMCEARIHPGGRKGQFGGISRPTENIWRVSKLFGRWKQRCVLSLSLLQQLADVVAVPEIRSLTVSDISQTSVTLSWSVGNTQHFDLIQVNQKAIDLISSSDSEVSNRRLNASSTTSHTVTTLSPGTTYEFYLMIQSYGNTAKTDARTITTGTKYIWPVGLTTTTTAV